MRYRVHYVWFDQRAIESTCRLKPLKQFGPLLKVGHPSFRRFQEFKR